MMACPVCLGGPLSDRVRKAISVAMEEDAAAAREAAWWEKQAKRLEEDRADRAEYRAQQARQPKATSRSVEDDLTAQHPHTIRLDDDDWR